MRRKNEEPLNLGGLTKSAAAMMAAKHVSALKTTATDNGDGDIEVVGVVPGPGSKMTNIKNNKLDINIINKLQQTQSLMDSIESSQSSASAALAAAAVRQVSGTGMTGTSSTTSVLNLAGLPNYSALAGSTESNYTSLMAAAAARDPYYQALLASGLGSGTGSNTVDLLQKCKYCHSFYVNKFLHGPLQIIFLNSLTMNTFSFYDIEREQ